MEQESRSLGRGGSGKAELGESIWSNLLPCLSPQCNEMEREERERWSSGPSQACAPKSTHPTSFTAGTGATPGAAGGCSVRPLQTLCGAQCRARAPGHEQSVGTYSGRGAMPNSVCCTPGLVEERQGIRQGHNKCVRTQGAVGAPPMAPHLGHSGFSLSPAPSEPPSLSEDLLSPAFPSPSLHLCPRIRAPRGDPIRAALSPTPQRLPIFSLRWESEPLPALVLLLPGPHLQPSFKHPHPRIAPAVPSASGPPPDASAHQVLASVSLPPRPVLRCQLTRPQVPHRLLVLLYSEHRPLLDLFLLILFPPPQPEDEPRPQGLSLCHVLTQSRGLGNEWGNA